MAFSSLGNSQKSVCFWLGSVGKDKDAGDHCENTHHPQNRGHLPYPKADSRGWLSLTRSAFTEQAFMTLSHCHLHHLNELSFHSFLTSFMDVSKVPHATLHAGDTKASNTNSQQLTSKWEMRCKPSEHLHMSYYRCDEVISQYKTIGIIVSFYRKEKLIFFKVQTLIL